MKNKKFIALFMCLFLFGTVGYANNFMIQGLGFVVPSIIGKSNIYQPQVGELVYDSVDSTFYGYDQNGQWQALGGGGGSGVPAGTILPFGGTTAPAGYLLCDGQPVSRMTYGNLYSAVGDAFGAGDGVNTFNVPDLRGRFLRGVDGEAGRDPNKATRGVMASGGNAGNVVGSVQLDSIQNITGATGHTGTGISGPVSGVFGLYQVGAGNFPNNANSAYNNAINFDASRVARTSSETRPQNAYVNYIIKI